METRLLPEADRFGKWLETFRLESLRAAALLAHRFRAMAYGRC